MPAYSVGLTHLCIKVLGGTCYLRKVNVPRFFIFKPARPGQQDNNSTFMKNKTLFEQLSEIPRECTSATIQGVQMQIIDSETRKQILEQDPCDTHYHECILSNGTFIFTTHDKELSALYKVM